MDVKAGKNPILDYHHHCQCFFVVTFFAFISAIQNTAMLSYFKFVSLHWRGTYLAAPVQKKKNKSERA
jgi:hypothetical protein